MAINRITTIPQSHKRQFTFAPISRLKIIDEIATPKDTRHTINSRYSLRDSEIGIFFQNLMAVLSKNK